MHPDPAVFADWVAFTNEDASQPWTMPQPPAPPSRLPLPVCVPQLTSSYGSPFARSYCSELAAAQIAIDDWLSFCDGLNLAMTANPPLRVVDVAGKLIGISPFHWAIIVGITLQAGAQIGQRVISNSLTDQYLRPANERFFGPRGLQVRLCKTATMRQLIGIDAVPDQIPSKAEQYKKSARRAVQNVALRLPLPIKGDQPVPRIDANTPLDMTGRRVADLEGYACPLDLDVPPSLRHKGFVDRMNNLAVQLDRRRANKTEEKNTKRRQLLAVQENQGTSASSSNQSDQKGGRWLRQRVANADRLEYNMTEGMLWIVVLNAGQDI